MPLRPVIHIQPTQPLESTLVLMRYYHQLPPIKWKADDMLDLYQDVEQYKPTIQCATCRVGLVVGYVDLKGGLRPLVQYSGSKEVY